MRGDDNWVADRVKQAMDAGYDAFCITVEPRSIRAASATSPSAS